LLRLLSMQVPPERGCLMDFVRGRFGASAAFTLSWNQVYAQMLWALALPCILLMAFGAFARDRDLRPAAQAIVLAWGAGCAVYSRRRFVTGFEAAELVLHGDSRIVHRARSTLSLPQRWARFLLLALPSLFLFALFIWATFLAVTQLIVHIIYDWGDCLNPEMSADTCRPPEKLQGCCRDAEQKHGIFGWAAEAGCDILLVIMVEIFSPISSLFAEWIADLRDHKYASDRECFFGIIKLALATLESMLFRVCFALLVAPQWIPPSEQPECEVSVSVFQTWCDVQTDLDVSRRRWVFEKLLKGPFCVAPFISILMKVIVPALSDVIASACHSYRVGGLRGAALVPVSGLFRILALIFTYDGGRVGCFRFVARGWPFANLQVAPTADAGADAAVGGGAPGDEDERCASARAALHELIRKPFEAEGELLEINLNFLGVLMFAPFMPVGVLFTLGARILEARTDLAKMLQCKRLVVPKDDEAMRRSQGAFMFAAVFAAAGWHVGVNLVTYNDSFWRWGDDWRLGVSGGVVLWLLSQTLLLAAHNELHRSSPAGMAASVIAWGQEKAQVLEEAVLGEQGAAD